MELQAVMDKLDTIDLKIAKLDKTISNMELNTNGHAQQMDKLDKKISNLELNMKENIQQMNKLDHRVNLNTGIGNSGHHKSMVQENRKYGNIKFADRYDKMLNNRVRRQVVSDINKHTTENGRSDHTPTSTYDTKTAKPRLNEGKPVDSNGINATSEDYLTSIIVDLYTMNDSMVQYYDIILDRLGIIEETLQTVVEDREYMSKDIKRVSKEVEGFAVQISDAIQDVCNFDYLKTGIDDIREDLFMFENTMNTSFDSMYTMNETLKLHIADTIHQNVGNFTSCSDLALWYTGSGVYNTRYARLYCDQQTDGGGWTVFQRRRDGSESFHRNWSEYKSGFGHLNDEFWLGNEKLAILTREGDCELFINMTTHSDYVLFAKYSIFKVHSEMEGYRLEVSGFSGDAEDGLKYHNGMKFSTYDRDNDYNFFEGSCAQSWASGWWFRNCYESDLNGKYRAAVEETGGVMWQQFSLQYVEMKLRCV